MKNVKVARLLGLHTSGTFDVEDLRGPQKKHARIVVLMAIGAPARGRPQPCGINAVYQEMYSLYGVGGNTSAEMNKQLIEVVKSYA